MEHQRWYSLIRSWLFPAMLKICRLPGKVISWQPSQSFSRYISPPWSDSNLTMRSCHNPTQVTWTCGHMISSSFIHESAQSGRSKPVSKRINPLNSADFTQCWCQVANYGKHLPWDLVSAVENVNYVRLPLAHNRLCRLQAITSSVINSSLNKQKTLMY